MPERRLPQWWELNGAFAPLPLWRKLRVPALVVYGGEDGHDHVPVHRSIERLQALRRPSGQLAITTIPDVGHSLADRESGELHPRFRKLLPAWIRQQTQRRNGSPGGAIADQNEGGLARRAAVGSSADAGVERGSIEGWKTLDRSALAPAAMLPTGPD